MTAAGATSCAAGIVTAVVVGSDDWFDDLFMIRSASAFEFQVTTLRPWSPLNFSAIAKSPVRQTHPSVSIFEIREALCFPSITRISRFDRCQLGEWIRDAIKLFCRQKRVAIVNGVAATISLRTLKPKLTLVSRISHTLVER